MIRISKNVIGIYAGGLRSYARGGRIAAGGGLFAGGPFAGGLFASGLNAAPRVTQPSAAGGLGGAVSPGGKRILATIY